MTKCKGCGALLQYTDPDKPGYSPKEGSQYCRRCFRLTHYDDLQISMRTGIDPDAVMKEISSISGVILWVVDLFDFEAGMLPGLNRMLPGRDIILAAGKRDLFPDTLTEEKIAEFVFSRLKEQGIQISKLVITSRDDEESIEEIRKSVSEYDKETPVIVMGRANAGKSTLLNRLMHENTLTMSRYPGTTLDFNEMIIDGRTYIDTPGIEISDSLLMQVAEKDLKRILPEQKLKPTVFQIHKDQTFMIGGLVRIDLTGCEHASVVFYMNQYLYIHRCKTVSADEQWKKHYGELLVPVPASKGMKKYAVHKNEEKMDVVIDGLGWACVHGSIKTVTVYVPKKVNVTFRKAML